MSEAPSPDVLAEQIRAASEESKTYRANLDKTLARMESKHDHTNGRLGRLERIVTFLSGAFAALSMPAAAKVVALLSANPPPTP